MASSSTYINNLHNHQYSDSNPGPDPHPKSSHINNSLTPDKQAKAKAIKLAQDRALTSLTHLGLYIALYIRDCPPRANDFHWALYLYRYDGGSGSSGSSSSIATKHHARNLGSGWITEHERVNNIFKELNLCCLLQIECLKAEKEEEITVFEEVMRSFDVEDGKDGGGLNAVPGINCRVWLFMVLRRLVERGLLRLGNHSDDDAADDDDEDDKYNKISKSLEALQVECMRIGNEHMHSAALNVQPRPVITLQKQ